MRFEALPGSPLPDQLRDNGYLVSEIGTTQRILPHAIEDKYVIGAGGDLELVTAGSTRPITQTVTHAGIVTTTVYELRVPAVPPDRPVKRWRVSLLHRFAPGGLLSRALDRSQSVEWALIG